MRLYDDLAQWWGLLSPPAEYAEEARHVARVVESCAGRPVRTMLELGCGGGHLASHLRAKFRMTLTDISESMLAVSRVLNPDCEHVQGDMRTMRLGRRFDAAIIHDAILYMTSETELAAAMDEGPLTPEQEQQLLELGAAIRRMAPQRT